GPVVLRRIDRARPAGDPEAHRPRRRPGLRPGAAAGAHATVTLGTDRGCELDVLLDLPLHSTAVQLLLWYNLGYLYEQVRLGNPFTGQALFEARTSELMTPLIAAVLGLGLHQAAYAAEMIRGGILSVDQGQLEAASALGIPARDRSLRIVLPQAMRATLPPAFNEVIGLVKGTSIVYVLAHAELFFTVQLIYGRTQEVLPMLLVATLWYVVITS